MIRIACQHENRKKNGTDRKKRQRWLCCDCGNTFYSDVPRPLGDMRTDLDDAAKVLGMLLEGLSIRACSRLTGITVETICNLILVAGENCERFLRENVKNVAAETIEMDELWDFIRLKARTKERLGRIEENGDSWTWLAIDAKSKLVLSHAVGLRDDQTCSRFLSQLAMATVGPCQVTSDGLALYTHRVPYYLGSRASFAQLVKTYSSQQSETRYSPATITGINKTVQLGNPDESKISTSYAERLNLSIRMHCRRYTRLTNAHSKTVQHHTAMTAILVAWYNYCRCNTALGKKTTPAMAAGLQVRPLTIQELLKAAA